MTQLVHELIFESASRDPFAQAVHYAGAAHGYGALACLVEAAGAGLAALGAGRHDRVAAWLPKREETVCALFGASAAGCVFVALDPALPASQAAEVLRDSGALVLVTTGERLAQLGQAVARCPALRHAVVCGEPAPQPAGLNVVLWRDLLGSGAAMAPPRAIDSDLAALQYTVSPGARPSALAQSHRNLVAAARSMVRCLGLSSHDTLLAALPLSEGFGLCQLTSAFAAGASTVLLNPLLARDIADTAVREQVTTVAAAAPMWVDLSRHSWPDGAPMLRNAVCSTGMLPKGSVAALRSALPHTRLYLMYGPPESFCATCLAQEDIEARPGSAGRPVPGADVLVVRRDGSACGPGEPGELVQRGALVSQGYWNNAGRTRDCLRPLPLRPGLALAETALWSGESAMLDADGYLYLQPGEGLIRTSGHRVSAAEVEDVLYRTGLVEEAAAVGVAHPVLGQVVAVLATPRAGVQLDSSMLLRACRTQLPEYMVPVMVDVRRAALPRDGGGNIDRKRLAGELAPLFAEVAP